MTVGEGSLPVLHFLNGSGHVGLGTQNSSGPRWVTHQCLKAAQMTLKELRGPMESEQVVQLFLGANSG
jgi:hypothetical protein